jgi:hypothetical protein
VLSHCSCYRRMHTRRSESNVNCFEIFTAVGLTLTRPRGSRSPVPFGSPLPWTAEPNRQQLRLWRASFKTLLVSWLSSLSPPSSASPPRSRRATPLCWFEESLRLPSAHVGGTAPLSPTLPFFGLFYITQFCLCSFYVAVIKNMSEMLSGMGIVGFFRFVMRESMSRCWFCSQHGRCSSTSLGLQLLASIFGAVVSSSGDGKNN